MTANAPTVDVEAGQRVLDVDRWSGRGGTVTFAHRRWVERP